MAIYLCIFIFLFILLSQGQGFYFYCVIFLLLSLPNSDPHLFPAISFVLGLYIFSFYSSHPTPPPLPKEKVEQNSGPK